MPSLHRQPSPLASATTSAHEVEPRPQFLVFQRSLTAVAKTLVTRPSSLCNHLRHVINLPLRPAVRAKSLLCEFSCALVFAVAEEFDNATFVGGETAVEH